MIEAEWGKLKQWKNLICPHDFCAFHKAGGSAYLFQLKIQKSHSIIGRQLQIIGTMNI